MKFGIACGGTGGHVLPGLAVADELARRGHEAVLWLSGRAVESDAVRARRERVFVVKTRGFSRGEPLRAAGAAARQALALFACASQMRAERPAALLAMGGYSSVGPGLAARLCGVPLVLHEANAVPGRAVRFLGRFARAVAVSFPQTADRLRHCRTVLTGFPLYHALHEAPERPLLGGDAFTVLVMGGSLGAHRINEVFVESARIMARRGARFQVAHLTGAADEAVVRGAYEALGIPHAVLAFLPDMRRAYACAHLAVCRAGAATCAELSTVGLDALLVPYPFAVHDHQSANALSMQAAGKGTLIAQGDLSAEGLADAVQRRMAGNAWRSRARAPATEASVRAAARKVCDLLLPYEKQAAQRNT